MKNWTIKDAVATIQNGKDAEAIKEIAKHFPVFFMAVAKNDLGALAAMMTDKMTVRRLAEVDDADATDADDEIEVNDEETTVEAEDTEDGEDLNSMSTKQLIALCAKRGIKVPKYGKNKAFYLAALQGGSAEADDADDDAEEAGTEADPYAGKNALQLYSICKQRGLKMEPRQKASVYIEALKKADAKAAKAAKAEEAADEDDGDWNDEEEEAPKKPAKKGKAAKKSAKKAEPEEDEGTDSPADDDDDWEI